MIYKIKKFLSNKLSILNEVSHIQKVKRSLLSKNDREYKLKRTVKPNRLLSNWICIHYI